MKGLGRAISLPKFFFGFYMHKMADKQFDNRAPWKAQTF